MMIPNKHVVFTYHGLHVRELSNPIDSKLFRNSISETDYIAQLKILRKKARIKFDDEGKPELKYRDLLFNHHTILITFDDGFQNTYRAAEIFFDIFGSVPITSFLTTNLVGAYNKSIWTTNIGLILLRGEFPNEQLEFKDKIFELSTERDRFRCFASVRNKLKRMTAKKRAYYYDMILSQSVPGELERLIQEYPEFAMLNLAEIKEMQKMNVTFQPHGHNHEILHSGQEIGVIESEICKSKHFIEGNLNQRCEFFAYPNGDYCEKTIAVLRQEGFVGALTTKVGIAEAMINNFEIPRLVASNHRNKFKRQLLGWQNGYFL